MSLKTLTDWLGHGGTPVPTALAEARGRFCEICPENKEPRWWELHKSPIADAIKEMMAQKHNLRLRVSMEDDLHMCRLCGCANSLKVWTPIEHVKAHAGDLKRYPSVCWIIEEIKPPK